MKISNRYIKLIIFIQVIILTACTNPFAPKITNYSGDIPILGDQSSIDGFFKNFSYAYKMKDTVVYGALLANDFTFIYRNYDKDPPVDEAWGRDIDMITTHGLFQGTQRLDLIWNEINTMLTDSVGTDSLILAITRSFTLDVDFSPNDKFELHGKADFRLLKTKKEGIWRITQWRDESNN